MTQSEIKAAWKMWLDHNAAMAGIHLGWVENAVVQGHRDGAARMLARFVADATGCTFNEAMEIVESGAVTMAGTCD